MPCRIVFASSVVGMLPVRDYTMAQNIPPSRMNRSTNMKPFFPSPTFFACAILLIVPTMIFAADPDGNATIRGTAGSSEIVITTTARLAGAIHSLTWNGKEFIDSFDHGRQLQSASNLDCATPITGETFNPTEAGSRDDDVGQKTTSRLLFLRAEPHALQTVTQMAFWLAPGEKSGPNLAKNTTVLSDHLLTKRVTIGYKNLPHVISYDAAFGLPIGERHTEAVFEALTGYMPPEFEKFYQFNPQSGELEPLTTPDFPDSKEDALPLVFAVPGGTHAMGIYAPPQPQPNVTGPTYGRFRFPAEKVVKWNCVFRLRNPAGIAPADYPFRMFVLVGDLDTVRNSLRELHKLSCRRRNEHLGHRWRLAGVGGFDDKDFSPRTSNASQQKSRRPEGAAVFPAPKVTSSQSGSRSPSPGATPR